MTSTSETEEFSDLDPCILCVESHGLIRTKVCKVMDNNDKVTVRTEGSSGRWGWQQGWIRDPNNISRKPLWYLNKRTDVSSIFKGSCEGVGIGSWSGGLKTRQSHCLQKRKSRCFKTSGQHWYFITYCFSTIIIIFKKKSLDRLKNWESWPEYKNWKVAVGSGWLLRWYKGCS